MPWWVLLLALSMFEKPYAVDAPWLLRYVALLEEFYQALPVPRNLWQRWVVCKLIGWIDREKEAALLLAMFETKIVIV
jgi:hypothetical protein